MGVKRPLSETTLITDANLVSYWKLDGNSLDSKGTNNGSDAAITYSTQYGIFGQGASFNGVSSGIQYADTSSLSLTSAFTLSIWINPISLPTSDNFMSLICKYDAPLNNNSGYDLRLSNNAGVQKIGLVTTNNQSVGGGDIEYTLQTGIWQNIIAMYGNGYSKIYINSEFVGQVINTINPKDGTKLLNIGNFGYYTPTASILPRWFNGYLDDIAIFNRVLTVSEISYLYEALGKKINGITMSKWNSIAISKFNGI